MRPARFPWKWYNWVKRSLRKDTYSTDGWRRGETLETESHLGSPNPATFTVNCFLTATTPNQENLPQTPVPPTRFLASPSFYLTEIIKHKFSQDSLQIYQKLRLLSCPFKGSTVRRSLLPVSPASLVLASHMCPPMCPSLLAAHFSSCLSPRLPRHVNVLKPLHSHALPNPVSLSA